jgi:hypothetical protein
MSWPSRSAQMNLAVTANTYTHVLADETELGVSSRARMLAVRWVITLSASKEDVERLLAASIHDLAPHPTEAGHMLLDLEDSFGDESTSESRQAIKEDIDLRARHISGFGKLRWGRGFQGVQITSVRSFNSAGTETQVVFASSAHGHLQPRKFADMMEELGFPRPPLPAGLEVIEGLDAAAVAKLAGSNPLVGRVLHLVELMLEGDTQIDWGAAYSALEAIEHDLHDRGVDGRALGWWTSRERDDFKATANSAEALGVLARHRKPGGVEDPRMSSADASWYVRRVAAYWLADLLQATPTP